MGGGKKMRFAGLLASTDLRAQNASFASHSELLSDIMSGDMLPIQAANFALKNH